MKALALGLLAAAAALYGLATWLSPQHAAWGYVAAFAEAAMVGAVADWFAVVALFRHPMGLPIPHTAIIPSNKDRIGEKLADFLCNNFLSTPQVLAKLQGFDAAGRLGEWLSAPAHAQQLAGHLTAAARYGVGLLDDDRARHYAAQVATAGLQRVEVAPLAGKLLGLMTAERQHQALLDQLLLQIAQMLSDSSVQARITEAIAAEVRALRFVGLDQVAARLATTKVIHTVANTLEELSRDPDHALRLRFDTLLAEFTHKLQADPAWQAKGEALKHELLHHPAVAHTVHGLWDSMREWLQADLAAPDSSVRRKVEGSAQLLGRKLREDPALREWINQQLTAAAPRWIARYREDIRRYIVARVAEWNASEMTDELERHIGRDLQFIRINGTLVGGCVGLLIHAVTEWLH